MKITKEQVVSIIDNKPSHGLIILNLLQEGGIEVAISSFGRMSHETLTALATAVAATIGDATERMGGCQCPKCQAAKALSKNAPVAQA